VFKTLSATNVTLFVAHERNMYGALVEWYSQGKTNVCRSRWPRSKDTATLEPEPTRHNKPTFVWAYMARHVWLLLIRHVCPDCYE